MVHLVVLWVFVRFFTDFLAHRESEPYPGYTTARPATDYPMGGATIIAIVTVNEILETRSATPPQTCSPNVLEVTNGRTTESSKAETK